MTTFTDPSFPNVRALDTLHGPDAANKLQEAYTKLRNAKASGAAGRLERLDDFAGKLDFPTLERLADPELAVTELADVNLKSTRTQHAIRNAAALFPLLITWVMLGWASILYHDELGAHPSLSTTPFLLLWQQHFGRSAWVPTFVDVAFFDFVIIGVVLFYTVRVHMTENAAVIEQAQVTDSLYSAMSALAIAIEHSTVRPPASADEWAEAAKKIIADAMEETRQLAKAGRETVAEAGAALANIHEEGRRFIEEFSTSIMNTLSDVRRDNEQFITRTAAEARETLRELVNQQMTPLMTELTQMLQEFERHHATYRAGVDQLTTAVTSINASAQALASSARESTGAAASISQNMQRVADSQDKFVGQLTHAAAGMEQAATEMNQVTEVLKNDLRDNLRDFSANVVAASRDLSAVQKNLANTSRALNDSAATLDNVTRELRSVVKSMRGGTGNPFDSLRGLWRFIFIRR
jgi:hypothetical protein